jgi:hypothetical protein
LTEELDSELRIESVKPDVVRKLAAEWEAWAQRANVDRWPGPRLTNWGDPVPAK